MDLDAAGADISGESQINLSPTSGIDPSRMVKYVPTAATAIYPNVVEPITSPVSITSQTEVPTARALQIVPVVGENVQKRVDISPSTPVALQPRATDFSAQSRRVVPQVAEPQQYDYENRPKPPGTGEGMFGSNRIDIPAYDPNADPQEVAKQALKAQADRQMDRAQNPISQLFYRHGVEQNINEAAEKYGKIKEIEQNQQKQRDIAQAGANFGYRAGPNDTPETLTQEAVRRYKAGGNDAMQARDYLLSIGHKDQVDAFQPDFIASAQSRKDFSDQIATKLDAATTDQEYIKKRDELRKEAKHEGSGTEFKIPDTRAEWNSPRSKAQRQEANDRANILLNQYHQTRENVTNFVPEDKPELAKAYAGRAKYYDNTPIGSAEGVKREGDLAVGGKLPTGSHDDREYGKSWGNYTGADRKRNEEYLDKVLPKEERTKVEGLLRAYKGLTEDENGKPLPAGKINAQPVHLQILAETMAAIFRLGAGGANASIMAQEMAARGWLGNKINDVAKFFGALKGVTTGNEGKYLSKMTEKEKRDVLDFAMNFTGKDVGSRLQGPAKEAGMMGAKPNEVGLGEMFKFPGVEAAHAYGRDNEIKHRSEQYKILGDDHQIVLGDSPAYKNIQGAVRNPIPESQLPGLHPELFNAPPAATVAPGGSRTPPGTPTVPGGGRTPSSDDFWSSRPGGSSTTGPRSMLDFINPVSTAHAEGAPTPPSVNYNQADSDLKLSPQERSLYEYHLHNLNGPGGVDNSDGSRSSLYQTTVEHNGKQYIIPQVFDGKILSEPDAAKRVDKIGWDKFPSYKTPQEAEQRYQAMHGYMEKDTAEYLSRRSPRVVLPGGPQGRVAPIPPTVPTPQAPGGPGTSGVTASTPAVQGSRGGGTFSNGVPSNGFPSNINANPIARSVYGTAGQAAQNASSSPVIGTNAAIVAASSAQSESSFNSNETHDGGRGYGLFGHNGDRLRDMRTFAGTKPGEPIPPNVQAAFYAREMSREADRDPFISQVMRNPNATAEDLTRVQMRMEKPEGFKYGQEEEAPSWNARLKNTRALMGNAGQVTGSATVPAAPATPAARAASAPVVTGSLLDPRVARETIRQKAQAVGGDQAMATFIPPAAATGGMLIGGPAGAIAGGAAGSTMVEGLTKPPGERNLTGAAVRGGVEALPMAIPGAGPLAIAGRVATGAAGQGGLKWWEGGDEEQITAATLTGGAGAIFGEAVGQALGMAGHRIWSAYSKGSQAELLQHARTLATEQPKVMDATGKLVENTKYTQAAERAKQMGQDPDNLAYAWNQAKRPASEGGPAIPTSKNEAIVQRPGGTEQLRQGQQLEGIKQDIAQAAPAVPGAPFRMKLTHDPVGIVGTPEVPNWQPLRQAAEHARDTMNQKVTGVDQLWSNVTKARTDLLVMEREALGMAEQPGKQKMIDAYRTMADHVRGEQENIIRNSISDPAKQNAMLKHLEDTSNAYRKAVLAGRDDIVHVIAKGGKKGREAQAAFNELGGKDPAAKQMLDALVRLHNWKGQAGTAGGAIGGAAIAGKLGLAAVPVVGPAVAPVLAGIGMVKGFQLLKAWMTSRGGGNPVRFEDLVRRARGQNMPARGGQFGATAGANLAMPALTGAMEMTQ